jgi:hypothetical protein
MKRCVLLLGLICISFLSYAQLQTVFEKSNGKETATYQETVSYYLELAQQFEEVKVEEIGMTDIGFPLHLLTVSTDHNFDYTKAHEKGNTAMLIINGIHPGEPDGIEACMLLLRDMLYDEERRKELNNIILAVIPIYNVGGALNRNSYSRTNQNGPLEYGFRGNGQNLDLNRDFIKMDSKNAQTFARIYHKVNPDILIDTHVSNGADYQYNISHLATQANKLGGDLGEYLRSEMIPQLEAGMKKRDEEIIPYVNVFNATPDAKGYSQFMDYPRFSTGYAALFYTLGFTIETHMLKPFDVRVPATYRFIETMIEIAGNDGPKIKALRSAQLSTSIVGKSIPMHWEIDKSTFRSLQFKGYEGLYKKSEITGFDRLYFDRDKPFTKEIPYYNVFKATSEIVAPRAYVIPQAWGEVIERLQLNEVVMKRLPKDTTLEVKYYRIEDFKTSKSPYEAHYPHNSTIVSANSSAVKFHKGDYWISVDQPAERFLAEVLEPQGVDSYFNWNFFDPILQQKEYFSPYVFEEIALKLLEENTALKKEFDQKKSSDQDFSNSWYAQLNFIYQRSPHHETAYMRYPVYSVIK